MVPFAKLIGFIPPNPPLHPKFKRSTGTKRKQTTQTIEKTETAH